MHNRDTTTLKAGGLLLALMTLSATGYADDVEDSIDEALESYKSGEYKDAMESLNYASQLIQQKRAGTLTSFLPEPLDGWTAEGADSKAAGAAMFGGGTMAKRRYRKDSASVTVEIITDSPLMQGVMMMFSNPMFATSDGGKLERIGRQKAVVKFDPANGDGEIKIVVAKRYLVTIEGQGVTEDILKSYAKAIDYKKLKALP